MQLAPLIVFNPRGRDRPQEFRDGAGSPEDGTAPHPPVNFHAYTACVRGSFHTDLQLVLRTHRARPVLLLLRRDPTDALRALRALRAAGRQVAVTFKESGTAQIAGQLTRPTVLKTVLAVLRGADAVLAPTPEGADFARAAGAPRAEFLPTPYPVDDARWDFSVPAEERRGIWVGTREFGVPARQHLAAVLAASRLGEAAGEPVTVVNAEGRPGARLLKTLGFSRRADAPRRFLPAPLPYAEYLRAMARHRFVLQFDRSGVPGQVAGDALLCRLPCVGGDGAVERLAAPDLCGHGRDPGELFGLALNLLSDPTQARGAVDVAQARARETLSFGAVAARLAAFFARPPA